MSTWQGEGVHMGRKAYFIRTYGCPLKCDFCDSAGTWHPDYRPDNMERLTQKELARFAVDSRAGIIVLTGGEPAMHDWSEFIHWVRQSTGGYTKIHLETSGAFPLRGEFDWITLSPKRARLPITDAVRRAHEFKIIVEATADILFWAELLDIRVPQDDVCSKPRWLHPEWSQRENSDVLEAINHAVVNWGDPYRVGYQLHKLYRPDQRDALCRADVPLGGGQKLEPTRLPFGSHPSLDKREETV